MLSKILISYSNFRHSLNTFFIFYLSFMDNFLNWLEVSWATSKYFVLLTELSIWIKTYKWSSWAEPKTQNLQMFELSRASHAREDWLESVQLNYLCSVKQWVEKIQAENTFLSKFLYTIINIPWLPGCVLKVVWWSHKLPCDFHLESGWVGL